MNRKLRKKKGRKIYAKRKTIIELFFGQMNECRVLRGFLQNMSGEGERRLAIWSMTHNLNKLFRYGKVQAAVATG